MANLLTENQSGHDSDKVYNTSMPHNIHDVSKNCTLLLFVERH